MTTLSYDLRVSVNARDTYIEQIGWTRTVEHWARKSFDELSFQRTLEWLAMRSTEDIAWQRTVEHRIAGSLSDITWYRSIEHQLYGFPNFTSSQARNLTNLISPQGSVRAFARDLVLLKNPKFVYDYDMRTSVNAKTTRSSEGFAVILENSGDNNSQNLLQKVENQAQIIQQIDASAHFNWTGTFNANSRFGVGYRQNGGAITAIENGLPITTNSTPTLRWSAIYNPELDQSIEYRIQIAPDIRFKKMMYDIRLSGTQYTIPSALPKVGTYYWRIKSYDKFGSQYLDESDWSNTFDFEYKTTKITSVPTEFTINWNHPFLLPPGTQHYSFNTKNLPSKDGSGNFYTYEFCVIYYQFDDAHMSVSTPIPSSNSLSFLIDHRAANPPIFLSATYDEQTHHVALNVLIDDSMGRIYRLKDFQYLDRTNPTDPWILIDDFRIIGQKDNLNSRPNAHNRGLITWGASADADILVDQELNYNVRILSEPEHKNNDFYYLIESLTDQDLIDAMLLKESHFGPWWNKAFSSADLPQIIPSTGYDEDTDIECAPILVNSGASKVYLEIAALNHSEIIVALDMTHTHLFECLRGFEPTGIYESEKMSLGVFRSFSDGRLFDLKTAIYNAYPELQPGTTIHLEALVYDLSIPVARWSTLFNPDKFHYREELADRIPITSRGISWNPVHSKLEVFVPISIADSETIAIVIKLAFFEEGTSYLDRSLGWTKIDAGDMHTSTSMSNKYIRPCIHHTAIYGTLVYYGMNTTYRLRHQLYYPVPTGKSGYIPGGYSEWSETSLNYGTPEYVTKTAPNVWRSPAGYFDAGELDTTEYFTMATMISGMDRELVGNSINWYKHQVLEGGIWIDLSQEFAGNTIYQKWVRVVVLANAIECPTEDYGGPIYMKAYDVANYLTEYNVIVSATMEGTGQTRVHFSDKEFYSSKMINHSGKKMESYRNGEASEIFKFTRFGAANQTTKFSVDLKNIYYIENFVLRFFAQPTGEIRISCWQGNVETADYKYIQPTELVEFPIRDDCSKIMVEIDSTAGFTIQDIHVVTYSIVPEFYPVPSSYLKFVNTEETDIVMQNWLIDLKAYYDYTGLPYPWEGTITDPNHTITPPEGVEFQKITKYGMLLRYRVSLFRDQEALNLLYSKMELATQEIEMTNIELFREKITNVALDVRGIKPTFYELTYANIKMLEDKMGNADYWIACRAHDYWFDGVDTRIIEHSNWSRFARQKNTNIYTIFWNIRGMGIEPSSHIYLKCVAVLSSPSDEVEIPIFGFLPKTNVDLRKAIVESTSNTALKGQADKRVIELTERLNSVFEGDTLTITF